MSVFIVHVEEKKTSEVLHTTQFRGTRDKTVGDLEVNTNNLLNKCKEVN